MLVYQVRVDIDPEAAEAFEAYMRRRHIPDIHATGCFARIAFRRASPTRFATDYEAASRADLDRYLQDHAAHFRADFLAHFPEGHQVQRDVWESLQAWGA